jgi:hypothetical protein
MRGRGWLVVIYSGRSPRRINYSDFTPSDEYCSLCSFQLPSSISSIHSHIAINSFDRSESLLMPKSTTDQPYFHCALGLEGDATETRRQPTPADNIETRDASTLPPENRSCAKDLYVDDSMMDSDIQEGVGEAFGYL